MNDFPAHRSGARLPDPDPGVLAGPALAIGVGMLALAVVFAARLPDWARDYGAELVYSALMLHVGSAVLLLRWGFLARGGRWR
ncbi:hypothetical protein [Nocardia transvalensis]|uniref:hypothetical protein n=1 Tax=Nocardia transvalensis TaxID=37333 RepID=UPI001893F885|nr:hypothetical protein [Nocardia transvalensis]MBF6331996.1 hypothetical protein [Nocardia transvalensis]